MKEKAEQCSVRYDEKRGKRERIVIACRKHLLIVESRRGARMEISVIVCTRNRAPQLSELLASMCELTSPGVEWECIVVDNGSTDNTSEVVASFENVLPIRRILQPIPGLSHARNAGVDSAQGRYIVWTDDDARVGANWLAGYVKAFNYWPQAVLFGGKITAVLRPPTPDWFQRGAKYLTDLLCVRDFGDQPIPLSMIDYRIPYGVNYAIRATEQKQYRYDPTRGVAPGRRLGGEETDVMQRILESGKEGWWVTGVDVEHIIPSSRQTASYIFHYYEADGERFVYKPVGSENARPWSTVLLAAISLPSSILGYCLASTFGLNARVRFLRRFAQSHGMLKAYSRVACGIARQRMVRSFFF
jgi:glycosyltransferase involved in cell wall biosynthesis